MNHLHAEICSPFFVGKPDERTVISGGRSDLINLRYSIVNNYSPTLRLQGYSPGGEALDSPALT
jgi:hypothetical protein